MPSERMQRRIDALLDEAAEAVSAKEWALVADKVRVVPAIDPENEDATGFLRMAPANGVHQEGTITPQTASGARDA